MVHSPRPRTFSLLLLLTRTEALSRWCRRRGLTRGWAPWVTPTWCRVGSRCCETRCSGTGPTPSIA